MNTFSVSMVSLGCSKNLVDSEGMLGALVESGALVAANPQDADVIRVLYGYSFADDAIVGIRVLETKETPGLGDKIETDPVFLENFHRLDVSLTEDISAILNPIVPVKSGEKEHPWQVDCITGATISSKAIANMLSKSSRHWVPRIRQHLDIRW